MLSKLQIALLEIEKDVEGSINLIIKEGIIELWAMEDEESGFVSARIRQELDDIKLEITRERIL